MSAGTPGGPPRPPGRPGVAPERTTLAWTRTVLAYGVGVLLCLRLARESGGRMVAVAVVGGTALAALGVTARRRQHALPAGVPRGPAAVEAAVATALTLLLAAGAAALVVLH